MTFALRKLPMAGARFPSLLTSPRDPRSLVRLVDVLLGQAGVSVFLQVAADPVASVQLVSDIEGAGITAAAA